MIKVFQQDFYNTGLTNSLLSISDNDINNILFGTYTFNADSNLVKNYDIIPDFISLEITANSSTSKELFFIGQKSVVDENTWIYKIYVPDGNHRDYISEDVLKNNVELNGFVPEGIYSYGDYLFADMDSSTVCELFKLKIVKNRYITLEFPHWKSYKSVPKKSTLSVSIFTKDKKDIVNNGGDYKFNRVKNELDLCYNYEKDPTKSFTGTLNGQVTNESNNFYICPSIGAYNTKYKPYLNVYQTPNSVSFPSENSSLLLAYNEDDLFSTKQMKDLVVNVSWGADLNYMNNEQKDIVSSIIPTLLNLNTKYIYKPFVQFGKSPNPYIIADLGNVGLTNIENPIDLTTDTYDVFKRGINYDEYNIDYPIDTSQHYWVYYGTANSSLKPRYPSLINFYNASFYENTDYDFGLRNSFSTQISLLNAIAQYTPYNEAYAAKTIFKDAFYNSSLYYTTYDATNTDRSNGVEKYTSNSSAWFVINSGSTVTNNKFSIDVSLSMTYATGLNDENTNELSVYDGNNNIRYVDLKMYNNPNSENYVQNASIYNIVMISTILYGNQNIYSTNKNPNVNIYLRSYDEPLSIESTTNVPFFPSQKIAMQRKSLTSTNLSTDYLNNFDYQNTSVWINGVLQSFPDTTSYVDGTHWDTHLVLFNSENANSQIIKPFYEQSWGTDADHPYVKLWFEMDSANGMAFWKLCGDVSIGEVSSTSTSKYYWSITQPSLTIGVNQFTTDKFTTANIYKRFISRRKYIYKNGTCDFTGNDGVNQIYFKPVSNGLYYKDYLNNGPCIPLWWANAGDTSKPTIGIPYIDPNSTILSASAIVYSAS